jgi:hypothetical protein
MNIGNLTHNTWSYLQIHEDDVIWTPLQCFDGRQPSGDTIRMTPEATQHQSGYSLIHRIVLQRQNGTSKVWTDGIRVLLKGVKNQVFLSIFVQQNWKCGKSMYALFKTDNICASRSLNGTTNVEI